MYIKVLKKVSNILNESNCTWGIGGSVLLNYHNLVEEPKDIDIIINPNEAEKIKKYMNNIGAAIYLPYKEPFKTKEFFGYIVDGTKIEFMGDLKIDLGNGKVYNFIFDENSIVDKEVIDNIEVKFTSLEDWIVAYRVMKDPKKRVNLIKQYFEKFGVKNKQLLKRNLNQEIPDNIKKEIVEILKC